MNRLLQCYLHASCLLLLHNCTFLALYSCKDVVMEHKHNNRTGKTFTELLFAVVCTGCKQANTHFSLLSLQLLPVLSPPTPPRFSLHFLEAGPPSLNCPVVQPLANLVPGFIDTSLSAALQLCASMSHYCLLAPTSQQDYFPAL